MDQQGRVPLGAMLGQSYDIREPNRAPTRTFRIGNAKLEGADCRRDDLTTDVDHGKVRGAGVTDEAGEPLASVGSPRLVGRRDILEDRMIWVAYEVLVSRASVVLDFGCWSPDERYAIRVIAEQANANFTMEYLRIPELERRVRCDRRWVQAPETTFEMTSEDHDRFLSLCQPPTANELSSGPIPQPPVGFETWPHWASDRWPSLPRLDT